MNEKSKFLVGEVVQLAVRRNGVNGYSPAIILGSIRDELIAHPVLINMTPLPVHFDAQERTILSTRAVLIPSGYVEKTGERWSLEKIFDSLDSYAILTERGSPLPSSVKEKIKQSY